MDKKTIVVIVGKPTEKALRAIASVSCSTMNDVVIVDVNNLPQQPQATITLHRSAYDDARSVFEQPIVDSTDYLRNFGRRKNHWERK